MASNNYEIKFRLSETKTPIETKPMSENVRYFVWPYCQFAYYRYFNEGKQDMVDNKGGVSVAHFSSSVIGGREVSLEEAKAHIGLPVRRFFDAAFIDQVFWVFNPEGKNYWVNTDGSTSPTIFDLSYFLNSKNYPEVPLSTALATLKDLETKNQPSLNNQQKESEQKNMSRENKCKFKVGDKVKNPNSSGWSGPMVVKSIGHTYVTVVHPENGEGEFYPTSLELIVPAPSNFSVNTLGITEVKVRLVEMFCKLQPKVRIYCPVEEWSGVKINFNFDEPCVTHGKLEDNYGSFPLISIEEAFQRLTYVAPAPKVESVKLNAAYTAVVTQGKDTVTVGCQEIPISVIQKLAQVVVEVNK